MTNFIISKKLGNETTNDDVFRARIDGKACVNLDEFYEQIALKLDFPDYFGQNLDALDEMLNDLSWLDQNALIIEIENFDEWLEEENIDTKAMILSLLDQAADDQKMSDDGTHIKVIFEKSEGVADFLEEMGFEYDHL